MATRKTKSDLCRVAVSEMIFQRKWNPETYPCTPLFLSLCNHHNDYCHRCDYIRYTHRNYYNDCNGWGDLYATIGREPFEGLIRYLADHKNLDFFLAALIRFFLIVILCISCTFAQWSGQLFQLVGHSDGSHISWLHRGISDTLAFSKCAGVQGVNRIITEKSWPISSHFPHYLHFQVPKCG